MKRYFIFAILLCTVVFLIFGFGSMQYFKTAGEASLHSSKSDALQDANVHSEDLSDDLLPVSTENPDDSEDVFDSDENADNEDMVDAAINEAVEESRIIDLSTFVLVKDYIPDVQIDLRYSKSNNFTGVVIYDFNDAFLRYGTVEKLKKAQEALRGYGLKLLIWDAFRPVEAQYKLWEVYPDSRYVANPNKGFSSHSRGNTVDVSIVSLDGTEVIMPTDFDDFSPLADRDYDDCSSVAAENAKRLEEIMEGVGFKPYFEEWWHFSDSDQYPVEKRTLQDLGLIKDIVP